MALWTLKHAQHKSKKSSVTHTCSRTTFLILLNTDDYDAKVRSRKKEEEGKEEKQKVQTEEGNARGRLRTQTEEEQEGEEEGVVKFTSVTKFKETN